MVHRNFYVAFYLLYCYTIFLSNDVKYLSTFFIISCGESTTAFYRSSIFSCKPSAHEKDALEKSGLHTNKKRDWYNRGLLTGGVKYQDDIDEANDMIEKLNRQKAEREELISNESNYSPEKFKKKLASIEDDISTTEGQLTDSVADISDKAQDLWDDNGNLIDESARNTAKRVQQLTDNYKKAVGSTSTTSDKMNNIFALSQFSDLKDKLIAAGKSGGTDAIQKMIDDTDGLKDAMSNAGLTADDLKREVTVSCGEC